MPGRWPASAIVPACAPAGLNMQLISNYLGGKARLYADLQRQRGQASLRIASPCQPLDQVVAAFFKAPETNQPWARLPA